MPNVTRHADVPSGSKVTRPAFGFSSGRPATLSQEMHSSGTCSVIRASHSRTSFSAVATSSLTLATQWRRPSPSSSIEATPSIHWG